MIDGQRFRCHGTALNRRRHGGASNFTFERTVGSRPLAPAAQRGRSAVPNNDRGLRRRAAGRVGKRFFRTPAGALLLEHAGRAFAELEAAQEELRQLRGWWRGGCASAPAAPPASTCCRRPCWGRRLGLVRRRDKPETPALRMFLAAVTGLSSESRAKARAPGGGAAGRAARRAPR
jgi:hypothetical protein